MKTHNFDNLATAQYMYTVQRYFSITKSESFLENKSSDLI